MTIARATNRIAVGSVTLPDKKVYDPARDGVTQGLLADFATCRQRALFRVNRWAKERRESEALYFGSLCHYVLEQFYRSKRKTAPQSMVRAWIDSFISGNPFEDPSILRLKAEALLTVYFETFAANDKERYKPVRVEEVFDTTRGDVRLRGRKDFVFDFAKSGKRGMMEHKTKSRIDHDYLGLSLAFDNQNGFYDFAEAIQHGKDFSEIIYNILRTPQQKPSKIAKTKTSPSRVENANEFLARMLSEIRAEPQNYFYRYNVTFTPRERQTFRRNTDIKLSEFNAWLRGESSHYRNEAGCLTPFRCNYLEACSSGFMTGYVQGGPLFPELEE